MEITTTHGIGRPLSEAQRGHLTALIAAMNVAQVRLEAAQKVAEAQQEAAQAAFDSAQATAQAFLNYCGAELGCTFSDGDWRFDQGLMAFVRQQAQTEAAGTFEPEVDTHNGRVEGAYAINNP
jgi:multidrug efflux pump subunit AcrA (membrane-fusion protein)